MNMMSFNLDLIALTLFAGSWTIGMVAMMFPTAVPMILMFFRIGRNASPEIRSGGGPTITKALLFTGAYIFIWGGVGVLFYLALVVSFGLMPFPIMDYLNLPTSAGFALLVAGLYQLSPLKAECLDKCHPSTFLFRFYHGGKIGAVRMGAIYAKYCVGCCWIMMAVLLLIGAMGAAWMAIFALFIFVERAIIHRHWVTKILALVFLVSGVMVLLISFG